MNRNTCKWRGKKQTEAKAERFTWVKAGARRGSRVRLNQTPEYLPILYYVCINPSKKDQGPQTTLNLLPPWSSSSPLLVSPSFRPSNRTDLPFLKR